MIFTPTSATNVARLRLTTSGIANRTPRRAVSYEMTSLSRKSIWKQVYSGKKTYRITYFANIAIGRFYSVWAIIDEMLQMETMVVQLS